MSDKKLALALIGVYIILYYIIIINVSGGGTWSYVVSNDITEFYNSFRWFFKI
jgi:hypothetical protein